MTRKPTVNENQMAARICKREDNPIYKHQMIKEILKMYSDEIRKSMMNGERVQITGVGTIIPELKIRDGKYTIPQCNKTDGNPPPYTKIRMHENWKMREAMNRKLTRNIENGIYGLEKLSFTDSQMNFMIEKGLIPEDAVWGDMEEEDE